MPISNEPPGKAHDVDAIIAGVKSAIPGVSIVQMHQTFPADDDGLWWFRPPAVKTDIQIESSTYDCPFLVETNEVARTIYSIDEVVAEVVKYLRSIHG